MYLEEAELVDAVLDHIQQRGKADAERLNREMQPIFFVLCASLLFQFLVLFFSIYHGGNFAWFRRWSHLEW